MTVSLTQKNVVYAVEAHLVDVRFSESEHSIHTMEEDSLSVTSTYCWPQPQTLGALFVRASNVVD